MNKHQRHLLGLLKDIDGFCRKHGITYCCAGGTVIGIVALEDLVEEFVGTVRDATHRVAEPPERRAP